MNNHFKEIENSYKGKKCLLFGPGSSLNEFKNTFDNSYFKAAVNGTIIHEDYRNIDFYFWGGDIDIPQHRVSYAKEHLECVKKLNTNIKKYTCCWTNNSVYTWPGIKSQIDPDEAKKLGFKTFNQSTGGKPFYKNFIDNGLNAYSVAFQALQILLFMGFEEIILIGFDCGNGGYSFKNIVKNSHCDWSDKTDSDLIREWKKFIEFCNTEYPNVKLYSINPVGLKNIIKEYY